MGWLFGRKKKLVPKVPLPEGKFLDERALRFPRPPPDKIIQPEKVKQAAGISKLKDEDLTKPMEFPAAPKEQPLPELPPLPGKLAPPRPGTAFPSAVSPLYLSVGMYQQVLLHLDQVKEELSSLGETSRDLEKAEFSEENNFEKLKRSIKVMHDRLLLVDNTLFKPQSES